MTTEGDMHRTGTLALVTGALALAAATAANAQPRFVDQFSLQAARTPDWDLGAPQGECRLRIWVDDRARVQLRGDRIVVATHSGRRSFDQGSLCNQPLPEHRIRDFRVLAERGRGVVYEVERPMRANGYTGTFSIDDPQRGGELYEVVVAWHNPDAIRAAPLAAVAPLPFDEVRACQERVRGEFLERNRGDDAYIEFDALPARDGVGVNRERIRGDAWARNRNEARPVSYECVVSDIANRVLSASYEVAGRGRYGTL